MCFLRSLVAKGSAADDFSALCEQDSTAFPPLGGGSVAAMCISPAGGWQCSSYVPGMEMKNYKLLSYYCNY